MSPGETRGLLLERRQERIARRPVPVADDAVSARLARRSAPEPPTPAAGWSTGGRRRLRQLLALAVMLLVAGATYVLGSARDPVPPSVPSVVVEPATDRVPATPSRGAMGREPHAAPERTSPSPPS